MRLRFGVEVRGSTMHAAFGLTRIAVLLGFFVACSSEGERVQDNGSPMPDATGTAEVLMLTPQLEGRAPCEDGRLLIVDLPGIDSRWPGGLEQSNRIAAEWHADARLVEFRVSCALFEPGFRWQATYYSGEAQAMFAADTRESTPIDVPGDEIPTLDLEGLSYSAIRDALLSVDYSDHEELEPSTGVDLRMNSSGIPFGPPTAPPGAALAHVAIESRGEIKDLFVSIQSIDIFQYSSPSG